MLVEVCARVLVVVNYFLNVVSPHFPFAITLLQGVTGEAR